MEKTMRDLLLGSFGSLQSGIRFAEEWAEACIKITPTQENIEKQYEVIKRMEDVYVTTKILQ